jgi:glucosylceramidase
MARARIALGTAAVIASATLSACVPLPPPGPPPAPGTAGLVLTVPNAVGAVPPCTFCFFNDSAALSVGAGMLNDDTITVDTSRRYQSVNGFGFALTDTAAYLINQVPNDAGQRDTLMRELFDPVSGIGVSWVRLIIGPSDFTLMPRPWYSYRPTPAEPFDVSRPRTGSPNGDLSNIIPVMQQALQVSNGAVRVFAEPHSAPAWMKGNNDMWNLGGDGCLIGYCPGSTQDFRDQYAQYFIDFIHTYEANGIPIQAIGVQNEPNNITDYPGGNFTAPDQFDFIGRLKGLMAAQNPPLNQQVWAEFCTCEALNAFYIAAGAPQADGLAYHCYYGPPGGLNEMHAAFPAKSLNETECTQDSQAIWPKTIDVLIQNTRNWASVVGNWNLALDPSGGPQASCLSTTYAVQIPRNALSATASCTTHGTSMTAPVVISGPGGQGLASFTREYYEMGHFSKFVRPGAVRIGSTDVSGVMNVAFQNPDGSKVLIVHNNRSTGVALGVNVNRSYHFAPVGLPPDGIMTFVWDGPGPPSLSLSSATTTPTSTTTSSAPPSPSTSVPTTSVPTTSVPTTSVPGTTVPVTPKFGDPEGLPSSPPTK